MKELEDHVFNYMINYGLIEKIYKQLFSKSQSFKS